MQILDAVDHAELEAEISDRAVSRIALVGDRVARVIRGPDGFAVEHDAARGDVYLRPASRSEVHIGGVIPREPLTLFIGTAGGFTYRLALRVAERGSAQILIRNAAAVSEPDFPKPGDPHVGALVELIRAVVRREALPGYSIEAMPETLERDGLPSSRYGADRGSRCVCWKRAPPPEPMPRTWRGVLLRVRRRSGWRRRGPAPREEGSRWRWMTGSGPVRREPRNERCGENPDGSGDPAHPPAAGAAFLGHCRGGAGGVRRVDLGGWRRRVAAAERDRGGACRVGDGGGELGAPFGGADRRAGDAAQGDGDAGSAIRAGERGSPGASCAERRGRPGGDRPAGGGDRGDAAPARSPGGYRGSGRRGRRGQGCWRARLPVGGFPRLQTAPPGR